jgi:dCTP deaminase
VDETSLLYWANRVNAPRHEAFTPYLLGNRPFVECAWEALEEFLTTRNRDLKKVRAVVERLAETERSTREDDADAWKDLLHYLDEILWDADAPTDWAGTPPKEFPAGLPGLLSDRELAALAAAGMISPFVGELVRKEGERGVVSYGLSSYGYDARLAPDFKVFSNIHAGELDPKQMNPRALHTVHATGDYFVLPPHGFALGSTVERFALPRDVVALGQGKSTYARIGVTLHMTPMEPGWEGHITLAVANSSPLPVRVYTGEGIAQFLFFRAPVACAVSYADRKGKYQGAVGVTTARVP